MDRELIIEALVAYIVECDRLASRHEAIAQAKRLSRRPPGIQLTKARLLREKIVRLRAEIRNLGAPA